MFQTVTPAKGDCYEAAFKFLCEMGEDAPHKYKLVHGNVARLKQDCIVNNAWVEAGDVVHEASNRRNLTLLKKDYYEHFGITNAHQYSYEEALTTALKAGHYGPWVE